MAVSKAAETYLLVLWRLVSRSESLRGQWQEMQPFMLRSAPAQPPAEGTEGAAPGGGPPGPPPNLTSNRRLQQTQAQVEEVVDIMRVNVDKVLERDQKLSELDDRADALQAGASQFESSAAKLKRKYWWKNCKMMIMLGAICAIIVVVIACCALLCQHGASHLELSASPPSVSSLEPFPPSPV
ncbi:Vesicle-associated membrane protein 1 [Microtus ochrogaster]|uniref:Vesicle-associated membrane protein 1 n=1 Tax=Microtus ochrogaster TaxID=79684 RepID=A0A8J6GV74_MICOH|nr:Vesicle-associated membrane protein 1 [Microtus ochrogaster]